MNTIQDLKKNEIKAVQHNAPTTHSKDPHLDKEVFFPIHTPSGAFLYALYKAGLIDNKRRINKEKFADIPIPALKENQLSTLQHFYSENKVKISVDSNLYGPASTICPPAECEISLSDLHQHLENFALKNYGVSLNSPILVGGYLRMIMTSCIEFCQDAFAQAGLHDAAQVITKNLLDKIKRTPPDADIKYLIPAKTPIQPDDNRDILQALTDEVVKYFASQLEKKHTAYSDWTLAKNGLSNLIVCSPNSVSPQAPTKKISKVNKSEENKTVSKVRYFGLISFPKPPAFKIDIDFVKSYNETNPYADPFFNLGLDLKTKSFVIPAFDFWQAIVDILSQTIHINHRDQEDQNTWPQLLSKTICGYQFIGDELSLRELTLKCGEGTSECLKRCWKAHHPKNTNAAIAMTFQGCLELKTDQECISLWKEMSTYWTPLLKNEDHNLLTEIDKEIRIHNRPFSEVVQTLQALAFFNLFTSNNPYFIADFICGDIGSKPSHVTLKCRKTSFTLMLPWDLEKAFHYICHHSSGFFNRIYLAQESSKTFGTLLFQYKDHLSISWKGLRKEAQAMLGQTGSFSQYIGFHLLLCSQLIDEQPEAGIELLKNLPKLLKKTNHHQLRATLLYGTQILINKNATKIDENVDLHEWLCTLANCSLKEATMACTLWMDCYGNEDSPPLQILDPLFQNHPSLAIQLCAHIMTKAKLNSDIFLKLFNRLLKAVRSEDRNNSFDRLLPLAKLLGSETIKLERYAQPFNEDWKWFFNNLNYTDAADLFCFFAKKEVFNPDQADLDELWLRCCESMLAGSTLELTAKLSANIYKQRLWGKGWKDEQHIEYLCSFSRSIFSDVESHFKDLGIMCLNLANKKVTKDSSQASKVYACALYHLKQQITARKIQELNVLIEHPFHKLLKDSDKHELQQQIKVEAIINEFAESHVEAACLLLKSVDESKLSSAQRKQIEDAKILTLRKLISKKDYTLLKEFLHQFKNNTCISEELVSLLNDEQGALIASELLLNNVYTSYFVNESRSKFEWCLLCLESMSAKTSPLLTTTLQLLAAQNAPSKQIIERTYKQINEYLNSQTAISEDLKQPLCQTAGIFLKFLKASKQSKEMIDLIQKLEFLIPNIKLHHQVITDYLWALENTKASTHVIAKALITHYNPELSHVAIEIATQLQTLDDQKSLTLSLDLMVNYQIDSSTLWIKLLEKAYKGTHLQLQRKCWEVLNTYDDRFEVYSIDIKAKIWLLGIRCLYKSQSPEILKCVKNWKTLSTTFSKYPDYKQEVLNLVVKGSLNQIKNIEQEKELVLEIVELDKEGLNYRDAADTLVIAKKLATSSSDVVLGHLCNMLKHYLKSIEGNPNGISGQIYTIMARLFNMAAKEDATYLKIAYIDFFKLLLGKYQKHLDLLTVIEEAIKDGNTMNLGFAWTLMLIFFEEKPATQDLKNQSKKITAILSKLIPLSREVKLYILGNACYHPFVSAQDLVTLKGQSLIEMGKDAIASTKIGEKQVALVELRNDLFSLRSDSKIFYSCFSTTVDLAINMSAYSNTITDLIDLYIKFGCELFKIDEVEMMAYDEFTPVFNIFSQRTNLSQEVENDYYLLNRIIFEKIVNTSRSELHKLSCQGYYTFDEPSPFDKLLNINVIIHEVLCDRFIDTKHQEIYPLLPKYYFQRFCLCNNKIRKLIFANESVSFTGKVTQWGLKKYQNEFCEIRVLFDGDGKPYEPKLYSGLKTSIMRMQSLERLQIALTLINKIDFKSHLQLFFDLSDSLMSIVKNNPFVKYEANNIAIVLLFFRNIDNTLTNYLQTPIEDQLNSSGFNHVIKICYSWIDTLIELFEKYPITEQYKHINKGTDFLAVAAAILDAARKSNLYETKGAGFGAAYFKTIDKLISALFKKKQEIPDDIYLKTLNVFCNLICMPKSHADTSARIKTFNIWIKQMIHHKTDQQLISTYLDYGIKYEVFNGYDTILIALKKVIGDCPKA